MGIIDRLRKNLESHRKTDYSISIDLNPPCLKKLIAIIRKYFAESKYILEAIFKRKKYFNKIFY